MGRRGSCSLHRDSGWVAFHLHQFTLAIGLEVLMKRVLLVLAWWRTFAASVLALCLVGSNALSNGIRTQSGCSSMSSLTTKLPKAFASSDSTTISSANKPAAHDLTKARINDGYGKLPMSFEANVGQA